MIRILVTDDMQISYEILKMILEEESDLEVIGWARDGQQAVKMASELKPDLITMDMEMPNMNGLEATNIIMSTQPVPIVVVSSHVKNEEMNLVFKALEAGALAVIEKPVAVPQHPDYQRLKNNLLENIRSMSDVRLVRRRTATKPSIKDDYDKNLEIRVGEYELVAIGSSAGGPEAIHCILSLLPVSFPLPILLTQHITKGFTKGMVKWLDGESELKVKEAEDGEVFRKGTVYFAPDDYHLLVERRNGELIAVLSDGDICDGFRPAVTIMMESVAHICGDTTIGAILTGMGSDGAKGLLAMKQVGAYTFVQDKQSALVYGMPSSALNLGATKNIIPLEGIAKFLLKIAG